MMDGRPNNGERGQFREWFDEYQAADERVAEAVGDRRELRKRLKEAGINLPAFDRARKLNGLSDELREVQRAAETRYMEWLGKPLGFQAQMFEPAAATATAVAEAGRSAAIEHQPREANPFVEGTDQHAAWDDAWYQTAYPAAALADDITAALGAQNSAGVEYAPPRRPPGRPKGAVDRKPRKRRGHPVH